MLNLLNNNQTSRPVTMDPQIAEIAEAFSRTIFWNYNVSWPGDVDKEQDPPLEIIDGNGPRLRFFSGELTFNVAQFSPRRDDGRDTYRHEAAFVANLPVVIPRLLAEIVRLQAIVDSSPVEKPAKEAPKCGCELRDKQWDPATRHCLTCGRRYVDLATPGQLAQLNNLLKTVTLPPDTIEKWFKQEGVTAWPEMSRMAMRRILCCVNGLRSGVEV